MSDFDDRVESSRYADKNGGQNTDVRGSYNGAQGYGPQAGYNGAQGYGPQAGYNGAQGYGPQAGYNGAQGYGPQAGYNDAQGYGPQAGYNGAQGYGPQAGYNAAQGYGPRSGHGTAQMGRAQEGRTSRQARPRGSSRTGSAGYDPGNRKKRPGKKRKIWPVILIIILLLLLAAGGILMLNLGKVSKEKLNEILVNTGITTGSGYRNIVLYGVDSREGKLTSEAHSDTIIICSINRRSKEVKLASVYRDTYLDNTNGEYRKATECYYFGGPERSINMLNKNLDLDLSDFITVDFGAVIEIVDALGGIDLEITPEEMEYINGYCVENSQVTGVGYTPLSESGMVHLDGIQALAYSRIRYTEGWDFKRTERQRMVISLCYQKAKAKGIPALVSMVTKILPNIATSLSTTELVSLVSTVASYNIGAETGFPFDQTPAVVDGSDVVVPVNLAANVTQLHSFLFGEEGYTPSQTVQEISNAIAERSGIY